MVQLISGPKPFVGSTQEATLDQVRQAPQRAMVPASFSWAEMGSLPLISHGTGATQCTLEVMASCDPQEARGEVAGGGISEHISLNEAEPPVTR
jgi:hypothetical protein